MLNTNTDSESMEICRCVNNTSVAGEKEFGKVEMGGNAE